MKLLKAEQQRAANWSKKVELEEKKGQGWVLRVAKTQEKGVLDAAKKDGVELVEVASSKSGFLFRTPKMEKAAKEHTSLQKVSAFECQIFVKAKKKNRNMAKSRVNWLFNFLLLSKATLRRWNNFQNCFLISMCLQPWPRRQLLLLFPTFVQLCPRMATPSCAVAVTLA